MYQLISLVLVFAMIPGCAPRKMTPEDFTKEKRGVESAILQFWKGYEAKDQTAIENVLSTSGDLMLFGTDSAEIVKTVPQMETLIKSDWEVIEKVKFGDMRNLSIVIDGNAEVASAVYEVPFEMTMAGQMSRFLARCAFGLKKENGNWRLSQGMWAFATVGQSSADYLAKMKETKGGK